MSTLRSIGWRIEQAMRIGRRALAQAPWAGGSTCLACGRRGEIIHGTVLWDELAEQWELSSAWRKWFEAREGSHCPWCKSNLRAQQLAGALVRTLNDKCRTWASSLSALCDVPEVRKLEVAEINSAGHLHPILAKLPRLRYSEYASQTPDIPSEDLMNLSYAEGTFDVAITSEVLEHVPDVDRAMSEIRRVLKIGGVHVFTVPVVWDRPETRRRATVNDGVVVHQLAPSYHGTAQERKHKDDFLVFYEFGSDFVGMCESAGFSVSTVRDATNPSLVTFIARKST